MISKKWLRPIWIAVVLIILTAVYVWGIKRPSADRFFIEVSNIMFLWGLTLLCISLVYVTSFFGYTKILKNMFRPFRTYHIEPEGEKNPEPSPGEESQKRDASLVYASLVLIALSIPVSYI